MAKAIEQKARVSVSELSQQLSVSEVTIRKDLAVLEQEGGVLRTHGGAIAVGRSRAELAFEVRARLHKTEKAFIGAEAARLVDDGDSIALDASSTALQIARHLKARRELTVVTNGIRVATELAGQPSITVLMPGGAVRWEAFSLVGKWGTVMLRQLNIQKAFVGAVGFTLEEGLTDVNAEEAEIKRAMVVTAKDVIGVFDHTKWNRLAMATFCPTDRLRIVISDDRAPADYVMAVKDRGIDVRLVGSR
ncbi:MAG TPA: DeoR/GlpR family DNA-binding transcription regulator [Candidatus Dormibacteraeota bacterium]|nr:DeoR/GlpR family DNA-binding transcription regulator [Candidatus Dormibacteraeota bacterium]